jgi:predicted nucleic acid-binding Zn ribbon protein
MEPKPKKPCPICGKPIPKPRGKPTRTCSFECGMIFRERNRSKPATKPQKSPPKPSTPTPKPASTPPAPEVTEEQIIAGDTWTVNIPATKIQTIEQLIAHCKVDLNVWDYPSFSLKAWNMGAKDNDGKIITEQLFSVSAVFKRKVAVCAVREEIEALKRASAALPLKRPLATVKQARGGYRLEVGFPDAHLGKYCWASETGWENYDLGTAVEVVETAVESLVARSAHYAYDRVLLVAGNDLLNSDNLAGGTTSGTPQSNDGRWHKVYKTAREMLCRIVDRLVQHVAPVDVVMMPGNHDHLGNFGLGDSLTCFYNRSKHVTIDNAPTLRKYYGFGKVLLMFTHGDKGNKGAGRMKRQSYRTIMSVERPEMWGKAWWREIHTGHRHQVALEEDCGIRHRILPSLSPADAWHSENGFVGNLRSAEAYIWHEIEGHVGTALYTLPPGNRDVAA